MLSTLSRKLNLFSLGTVNDSWRLNRVRHVNYEISVAKSSLLFLQPRTRCHPISSASHSVIYAFLLMLVKNMLWKHNCIVQATFNISLRVQLTISVDFTMMNFRGVWVSMGGREGLKQKPTWKSNALIILEASPSPPSLAEYLRGYSITSTAFKTLAESTMRNCINKVNVWGWLESDVLDYKWIIEDLRELIDC